MTKKMLVGGGVVAAVAAVALIVSAAPPAAQLAKAGKKGAVVARPPPAASEDGVSVYFSPGGGCTDALVNAVETAEASVYVQAAQFTSEPIARALVAAHKRGVDVRVVVDLNKNEDKDSQVKRFAKAGVPVFADAKHNTAHNKLMIVDHRLVVTGSFNYSTESESENAENLVFLDGKAKLVAAYEANFKEHLSHSKSYGDGAGGK